MENRNRLEDHVQANSWLGTIIIALGTVAFQLIYTILLFVVIGKVIGWFEKLSQKLRQRKINKMAKDLNEEAKKDLADLDTETAEAENTEPPVEEKPKRTRRNRKTKKDEEEEK